MHSTTDKVHIAISNREIGDADDTAPDHSSSSLTAEQDAAVRAAVEHGYYKTPREIENVRKTV